MKNMLQSMMPAAVLIAFPMLANAGVSVPEIDGGEAGVAIALVGGIIALMKMARRPRG